MKAKGLPATQWILTQCDQNLQRLLSEELKVHPIISGILMSRDIRGLDDAKRFLHPSLYDLHNPFLMKDMQKGVHRLIKAIYGMEKITIYGDYDADGITSVVILLQFLKVIDADVKYYIPDRIEEGYGLNREAIDRMRGEGVRLIVTVDCGISSHEQVSYAKSLGIDTVILDHHEVPSTLPDAAAVINPNRADCLFPFKQLAGVGIVYNFLIALRGTLRKEGFWKNRNYPNLKEYLDLVALGTLGDISPLIDENRIFTKIGLELITEGKRIGLQALKEVSGMENQSIDSSKASFGLIPRINAAGRIASAEDAVELLMTDDITEAREIARRLDAYNRKRQTIEKNILHEIINIVDKMTDSEKSGSLVFASTNWHPGVIGIVASRLVDRYCRPAILISLKDGIGKGSGRSITNFDIYQGLKRCDSLLLSYGGHQYAAGISIREEDIEAFSDLLDKVVREKLTVSDFISQTVIDFQCSLSDISYDLISQMHMLAPFGSRNPEPVLCARNVGFTSPVIVGNNHLRMRIIGDGASCNSIWFSKGHYINCLSGANLDIAFTPQINYWNGATDIQLKMHDMALPV
ncbi:MAG: single-stranded-DNA-specific exonuclease RecJ [Deltaproteobacteria bacterium]|nr:single-stranded-DNA-specific exonuclease RecJ [Deltaproteobacteria bacterium]